MTGDFPVFFYDCLVLTAHVDPHQALEKLLASLAAKHGAKWWVLNARADQPASGAEVAVPTFGHGADYSAAPKLGA